MHDASRCWPSKGRLSAHALGLPYAEQQGLDRGQPLTSAEAGVLHEQSPHKAHGEQLQHRQESHVVKQLGLQAAIQSACCTEVRGCKPENRTWACLCD